LAHPGAQWFSFFENSTPDWHKSPPSQHRDVNFETLLAVGTFFSKEKKAEELIAY